MCFEFLFKQKKYENVVLEIEPFSLSEFEEEEVQKVFEEFN